MAAKRHLARAVALLASLGLVPAFDATCCGAARGTPRGTARRTRAPLRALLRASTGLVLRAGDEHSFFEDPLDRPRRGGGGGGVFGPGDYDEDELWPQPARYSYVPYELSAHELERQFVPDSLDRHRFTVAPDSAYAVIFQWSMLVGVCTPPTRAPADSKSARAALTSLTASPKSS